MNQSITADALYTLTVSNVCETLKQPHTSLEDLVRFWKPITPYGFTVAEADRIRAAFRPACEMCARLYATESELALMAASGILMGLIMESMVRCELLDLPQN